MRQRERERKKNGSETTGERETGVRQRERETGLRFGHFKSQISQILFFETVCQKENGWAIWPFLAFLKVEENLTF